MDLNASAYEFLLDSATVELPSETSPVLVEGASLRVDGPGNPLPPAPLPSDGRGWRRSLFPLPPTPHPACGHVLPIRCGEGQRGGEGRPNGVLSRAKRLDREGRPTGYPPGPSTTLHHPPRPTTTYRRLPP